MYILYIMHNSIRIDNMRKYNNESTINFEELFIIVFKSKDVI